MGQHGSSSSGIGEDGPGAILTSFFRSPQARSGVLSLVQSAISTEDGRDGVPDIPCNLGSLPPRQVHGYPRPIILRGLGWEDAARHTVPICSKNMRRSLAEMVCLTIAISLVSSVHCGFQRLFRIVSPCVTLVIVSSPPRNTIGASRSRAYMNSSSQPTVSTLICLPNNESANLPFQALAARSLRSLQHTCSGRVSSVAHFISIQHTNSTTTPRRPPAYMYVSLYVFQQIFLSRG